MVRYLVKAKAFTFWAWVSSIFVWVSLSNAFILNKGKYHKLNKLNEKSIVLPDCLKKYR